jgi:putative flippase GtrA
MPRAASLRKKSVNSGGANTGEILAQGVFMSVDTAAPLGAGRGYGRQIPYFVAIGALGYVVDAGVTYLLARKFGFDPLLARPPAFALATVLNFALNRNLTFASSKLSLLPAFVRYVMVCAAGLAVNYSVYAFCIVMAPLAGLSATPQMLPLFVACGSGVAMFVTFFGFRFFAFRV